MSTAATAWNAAASGWDTHAALVHRWLASATSALLDGAHIGPSASVLDVAAGTGVQTIEIARRVGPMGSVLATDISSESLQIAEANARRSGLLNITTQIADAQVLSIRSTNFDAAICRLGLMFCPSPIRALTAIRSRLAPARWFSALVFSDAQSNPCIVRSFERAQALAGWQGDCPHYLRPGGILSLGNPAHLAQIAVDAGFASANVTRINAPFLAASARQYVDFIRSSATPLREIAASASPALQSKLWTAIEDSISEFETPQGWEGPNELLLLTACT